MGLISGGLLAPAHAALMIYFGENQTPDEVVAGAPLTARNEFDARLTGVGTETFEGFSAGTAAGSSGLSLSFPGSTASAIGATISGDGVVFRTPSTQGRFNTTDATVTPTTGQWWQVSGIFDITFDTPIAAFGFYGTDIGDFVGKITVTLTASGGGTTTKTINNTLDGDSGALLFWGFVDDSTTYTKISFGNTATGTDVFGFDDMTVGDIRQVVPPGVTPEPTTLALVGLALAGLGARRRRA